MASSIPAIHTKIIASQDDKVQLLHAIQKTIPDGWLEIQDSIDSKLVIVSRHAPNFVDVAIAEAQTTGNADKFVLLWKAMIDDEIHRQDLLRMWPMGNIMISYDIGTCMHQLAVYATLLRGKK